MDKISKVVDDYYDFIVEYEKYINRNKDTDIEQLDMDKKAKDLANFIKDFYVKEYLPWRKIEGDIKEHLSNVFSPRNNEIIPYSRVGDLLEDTLYDFGYMDLTKYYKKQGLDVNDDNVIDKIIKESCELIDKDVLDPKIFSKDTLEIHPLARKISDICSRLWDIYKNEEQEIEM